MRRTIKLWEVYVTRFEDALERHRLGRLSADEAGEALGMSGRQFRRLRVRFAAEGAGGLRDHRLGRVSSRRAPEAELDRMHRLDREDDADFTVKHFHVELRRRHNDTLGYTMTRLSLQAAGLVAKARSRGAHRRKRVRRPQPGMLLFQDGSTHRWLVGLGHDIDLIVTLDDATSHIVSARFVAQEGTMSSFLGLAETTAAHGLFGACYTDRGSHYFLTPKLGGKVDKTRPTQVGRALAQLGIRHIPAYSPGARGRMERAFGTLQGRLPQALRVAGITTVAAANIDLREVYVPEHDARFGKPAAEPGTAFVRYAGSGLAEVLCVQDDRQVGQDNCVSWQGKSLQIPPQLHRQHYVRAIVRVHEYPDGRLALFDGPRCLARFGADGVLADGASPDANSADGALAAAPAPAQAA